MKSLMAALLVCTMALCAADNRVSGTWKLKSERILDGTPQMLGVGSVMTVRQDASGWVVGLVKPDGRSPNPGGDCRSLAIASEKVSPDGRSLEETVICADRTSFRVLRIWERQ